MAESKVEYQDVDSVIIRFAGDSGDGMQLTGTQFTNTAAVFGNDISTFPDFPSEIRAPAGTLAGVSGFQVNFSSEEILTPGDAPDVLVVMNPAALKANLGDLDKGGTIIINTDAFTKGNLKKADYTSNPLEDGSLDGYNAYKLPITTLNRNALEGIEGLSTKDIDRCKNFFALGLTFWIYDRPLETTIEFLERKFAKKPLVIQANKTALESGYNVGMNTDAFQTRYRIRPASNLAPGTYRKITGNEAAALGLLTAAQLAGKSLFYGTYPITPASDILHSLALYKNFDVRTYQAEDEIAAMGATIGAAFAGAMSCTGTSGPGLALKTEAVNLAVVLELPMVIVNVQRGGPSTGLPTKTEQSDLLQAMYSRNGESPVPVIAPATPGDCFDMCIEGFRMAIRASTPVLVLSDGYLGNSTEPWLIPDPDEMEPIKTFHPGPENMGLNNGSDEFMPYKRDPETYARPWAIPDVPGLEHRIGGLGKQPETGNVSYVPEEHEQMVNDRAEKIARLANYIPQQRVVGPPAGDLLVISWGSTYGSVRSSVRRLQRQGYPVSHAHIRYINPFPKNLEQIISGFRRILVPEMNLGQLIILLRNNFRGPQTFIPYSKVQGRPFTIREVTEKIKSLLED